MHQRLVNTLGLPKNVVRQTHRVDMRIACVLIRHFAIQLVRIHRPEFGSDALIISGFGSCRKTVLDASPDLMAQGVKPGMSIREACSICPEARLVHLNEEECRAVFERVLSILGNFSPLVEPAELTCAYMDIGGMDDEVELARAIRSKIFRATGVNACVGIASGKFFSWLAAFSGRVEAPEVVPPGLEKEFVAPFPIALLPCSDTIKEKLKLFGIGTVGELSRFPRQALLAQFSEQGNILFNLAHGIDPSPLIPRKKPEVISGTVEFSPPAGTYLEMLTTCDRVLNKLLIDCVTARRVCREIKLHFKLPNGVSLEKSLPLKEATTSKETLIRRLRAWFEGALLSQPVEEIEISLVLDREWGQKLPLWFWHGLIRREKIAQAAKELKRRFGYQPIKKVVAVEPQPLFPEERFRLVDLDQEP